MSAMKDFAMWFLSKLPEFLMSEPIIYLFGFILLAFVIVIIFKLTNIR